MEYQHPKLEALLGEGVLGCLVEGHHLHDGVRPLGARLVAVGRALPVALVRDLDAHDEREAEDHAKHVERVRVVPRPAL